MQRTLKNLRSVGPATIRDLALLGIHSVEQLAGQEAQHLYDSLCAATGQKHDICMLDVFACAIAQARNPALPDEQKDWFWWSAIRKGQPAPSQKADS
ncbi:MAG: helix-hairpin-helix domain-containing protein [Halodesulfovibrio sp.]